jgi:uncharacterized protein YecE (DUF72 family)
MPKLFIGTSGWDYPHWQGVFYPPNLSQDKWLKHYAEVFNCVELNVTFYRLMQEKVFQNWYKRTPRDFYFVAKGWRFITHIKKLKGVKDSLALFLKNACGLKGKLAAILWQLPPAWKKDCGRLEAFLKLLKKTKVRQAFEFRNSSWFDGEVYVLLKKYNACLCIAHSSRFPYAKELTADFLYLRFHGSQSLYSSSYSDTELEEWANYARGFQGKDTFAFFNNDAYGYAVKNALRFREFLHE